MSNCSVLKHRALGDQRASLGQRGMKWANLCRCTCMLCRVAVGTSEHVKERLCILWLREHQYIVHAKERPCIQWIWQHQQIVHIKVRPCILWVWEHQQYMLRRDRAYCGYGNISTQYMLRRDHYNDWKRGRTIPKTTKNRLLNCIFKLYIGPA